MLNKEDNFFLLAGPCAIEGEEMAMKIAERIVTITHKLNIPYTFKGSFKKANRSRIDSFTGIGDEKALKILQKLAKQGKEAAATFTQKARQDLADAELAQVKVIEEYLPKALSVAAKRT